MAWFEPIKAALSPILQIGYHFLIVATVLCVVALIIAANSRRFAKLSDAFFKLTHFQRVVAIMCIVIATVYAQKDSAGDDGDDGAPAPRMMMAPMVTPTASDIEDLASPTNSDLMISGIEVGTNSVALGISWTDALPLANNSLDLFASWDLLSGSWTRLAEIDLGTASSNIVAEIDFSLYPTNALEHTAFFRIATQADSDGDGLSDMYEEWVLGTDPNCSDSDGDLIEDGEELARGMNPMSTDSDGDGLSDMQELCVYETDPLNVDSDGDGLPDGWEIAQGLDPLDATGLDGVDGDPYFEGITNIEKYQMGNSLRMMQYSSIVPTDYISSRASWVTVTGDLSAGVAKSQSGSVTIPKGTKAFVGIFLHSDEYPYYTGYASQYNDVLSWSVTAIGNASITGTTRVNDENGDWSAAEGNGQYIDSWNPVVFQDGGVYAASADSDLQISVSISAMNVSDGALPSTVIVGVFPLENIQTGWPVGTGFGHVADSGSSIRKRLFEDEVGYINGIPSRPNITSKFVDLPEWIDIAWSATLTKERSERPATDNRTVATTTLCGNEAFDLYAMIGDSIGGSVIINFNISDRFSGSTRYKVRGKNPTDATARAYVDAHVPVATIGYAWKIAVHESRQGVRIYNQFNTGSASIELPNKGSGFGWGIAQIDNHSGNMDLTPFSQVWNWHENISAMNTKLEYALDRTNTFIGYYREAYGNQPNWVEPPVKVVIGEPVSAEMWSVLTIYNGVGGIPIQTAGSHSGFRSPLQFNPATGRWIFHSNTTNPDYVRRVVGAGMISNPRE